MSPRFGRLVLLVVVLAGSGCVAAAPPPDAGTGEGVTQVTLENSSLDLDADGIFDRVETIVGESISTDPPVYVLRGRDAGGGAFSYPQTPYGFVQDLGLTDVAAGADSAAGLTDGFGTVYLVAGESSRAAQETVLVHEFVHVVQIRGDLLPWSLTELQGNIPTDRAQARLAMTEGAAVWVTDQYVERHMPANVTLQSTRMREAYEEARVGGRFFLARYHLGYRAVDRRIDDPRQLRALYERDVPNTTEQLLHGLSPAEEPLRRFGVDAEDGGGWAVEAPGDEDRLGELFVRVALSKTLSLERAAAAADGWGYDRLITYERNDTEAYVWVTRWDDPANATEFEAAFERYLDGRRDLSTTQSFRVERLSETDVAVYSGPAGFVERANATTAEDGVRVAVGR